MSFTQFTKHPRYITQHNISRDLFFKSWFSFKGCVFYMFYMSVIVWTSKKFTFIAFFFVFIFLCYPFLQVWVCMYVCMCVCVYVMNVVCMHVCMYVMNVVCMCVCVYVIKSIHMFLQYILNLNSFMFFPHQRFFI